MTLRTVHILALGLANIAYERVDTASPQTHIFYVSSFIDLDSKRFCLMCMILAFCVNMLH